MNIVMKFEHLALNLKEPLKASNWYVQNLKMNIVMQQTVKPYITFLEDGSGRICLEFYYDKTHRVLNFWDLTPFQLHVAFNVVSLEDIKKELEDSGAILEIEKEDAIGKFCIFRDPWGVPLQFVERKVQLGR